MEEFEYNRFDLFHLTGSKVSFYTALLVFGPSNSCGKKKSHTICRAKFLLKVDFNCSEGGYPLKFPPLMEHSLVVKFSSLNFI